MKRLLLSSLATLCLLATGCATGAHSASARGLPLGSEAEEALRLEGTSITGPTSSLSVVEDGMRGRFRNLPVTLAWDYQKMTGLVGAQTTHLELAEGDDTRVWGTFGGLPVDLTEDGTWLHGRVGMCAYALKRQGDGFEGMRNCGSALERDITLAYPQALQARPLGERAALMTLMLVNARAPLVVPRVGMASPGFKEAVPPKLTDCHSYN